MDYIGYIRSHIGRKPIILSGSSVIVTNEKNEVLLQHRSDTKDWGVIGGFMEFGETFEETAKRELFEETGLKAEKFEIVGNFSGTNAYFKYPNGDEIYSAEIIFRAHGVFGNLKTDEESIELKYFPLNQLQNININRPSYERLKISGIIS